MVFFVLRYNGYFIMRAYSKQHVAKSTMFLWVLYTHKPTPPVRGYLQTSHVLIGEPSLGMNSNLKVPFFLVEKS